MKFFQQKWKQAGAELSFEQFQDSFVVGVHIIFFVPIGGTLCTVWNADRQAGLKFGNGYIGLDPGVGNTVKLLKF